MNTILMQRIFSAQESNESEVLDQLQNDIESALEDGNMTAVGQYSIKKYSDDSVLIHDEVNDEDTMAIVTDDEVQLCDSGNLKSFSEEPDYGNIHAIVYNTSTGKVLRLHYLTEQQFKKYKNKPYDVVYEFATKDDEDFPDDWSEWNYGLMEIYQHAIDDEVADQKTLADYKNRLSKLRSKYGNKRFSANKTVGEPESIIRIGDTDVAIDFKKGVAYNVDDERQHWMFRPTDAGSKVIAMITEELNGKKSKQDDKQKNFTAKSIAEHQNNEMMRNLANLSPEVQEFVLKKYADRFNKFKNFSKDSELDN